MRRWLTRPSLVVLVLATAVTAAASGSRAASRHEASFTYGSRTRQGVDAYWHDAGRPQPALLILHGGYWHSGGKGDWANTARYFADHGFAAFSADYRYDSDVAWPGQREDAVAAVDWIKSNAGRFDVDPTRVAVLGSQGGGQLATALAAYGAGRDRVTAAVALSPVASPYRAWAQAPTSAASTDHRRLRDETVVLNRCHPDQNDATCWARWEDSVVANQASGADDAPMYLLHSAGDTVPAAHSTDLRDAEVAKGMAASDITVETLPGSATGGSLLTTAVRDKVLAWLKARTRTGAGTSAAPEPAGAAPLISARTPYRRSSDDAPAAPSAPPAAESGVRAAATTEPTTGTYSYGTDPAETLDAFYIPQAHSATQPALVIVHGGYWYEGDKADWASTAKWYAERGYAVFSIDYRLNARSGWTAQRTDALRAIAWIRAHAATFSVAPSRVLILGSSAGGQIATAVGSYGSGTKYVRGVVALSPVASPYRAYNDGQKPGASAKQQKLRDTAVLLNRCFPTKSDTTCWKRWSDSVVKNHASSGDAPMYLFHSQGDFVPSAHSADLCAALKAKKVACALTIVAGSGHGGAILDVSGVHTKILKWLQAHD